ncbi:hypothetical protein E2C01_032439 [Portunus trituberculatus]|uniref:Uncharacterized protein n=1 Tax=Portunus trituberculatus TaxID=210409 RepID=A0A5B7EW03_PORTR|nr:hypothetical protein [Portunus trituberculatus]
MESVKCHTLKPRVGEKRRVLDSTRRPCCWQRRSLITVNSHATVRKPRVRGWVHEEPSLLEAGENLG